MENITLFQTETGSHIWRMNHAGSDYDKFKGYMAPTTDFLMGKTHTGGHFGENPEGHTISYEIGSIVSGIKLNNFNILMGVMSPITYVHWDKLDELRELVKKNISKRLYDSTHGLAVNNYHKYILNEKDNCVKRQGMIIRSLEWAISVYETGEVGEFKKPDKIDVKMIPELIARLDKLHEESTVLPDEPLAEWELDDFLIKLRLDHLKNDVTWGEYEGGLNIPKRLLLDTMEVGNQDTLLNLEDSRNANKKYVAYLNKAAMMRIRDGI